MQSVVFVAAVVGLSAAADLGCTDGDCSVDHVGDDENSLLQLKSTRMRGDCTESGADPYVTGSEVTCCAGTSKCLKNWDGGRWYYKCFAPTAAEADGAECKAAGPEPEPEPSVPVLPQTYNPHFDTTPDYLSIAATASGLNSNPGDISDNFYLVIGDQGGVAGGCNWGCGSRQIQVAEKMKEYVAQRKADNPNSKLLFVAAVGDNFYWTGASPGRFDATWKQIYGELTDVPWFSMMGNHDYGNSDPGTACAWKAPRFTCDQTNLNTPACGGAKPYTTQPQAYASNQLNADKGGVDGDLRKNYHMPDYTYYYTIPELDLEVMAVDWNAYDLEGLGGDGPEKSASALSAWCGGHDNLKQSMDIIMEASTKLMNERAAESKAKNVAILGHYPAWSQGNNDFRDMFIAASPKERQNTTKIFNFFGHAHTQVCFGSVDGECVNFQTGGGGGCCGDSDVLAGFTVIGFTDDKVQKTECFAPDLRCNLAQFAPTSSRDVFGPKSDVCDHTIDEPTCPNYQYPERLQM